MTVTAPAGPAPRRTLGRPEELARELAKRSLREVGKLSAPARPLPDFLLIGAKRGGSTSLWRYLAEHPGILPMFPRAEKIKGLYFFDENYERGTRWYRSHFATRATRRRAERRLGHRVVTGEATPYYLYHPLAPTRAHALVPDALVVAVLRDPVDRAYSHYKERTKNGTEPLSFPDAIAAEPDRLAGEEVRIVAEPGYVSFAHRHQSYVEQSRYAPMLERWFAAFGRDRVLVLASEEMYADPQPTVDAVTDRLGLPRHVLRDPRQHNARREPEVDPALRAQLTERLAPDVAAVEALLGRTMPWSRPA